METNQKSVSVIIPCYNAEAFIDQSIRSVYEQDYSDMELIVVNDGSSDNSEEQILAWQQRFSEKGASLIYLHQENQGPGAATNHALKYVTGKYLTLLDADDVYLPGAIRKKALFLDEHPDCAGVRNNGWMVKGKQRQLFIQTEEDKQITDLFTALSFGKTNNWAGSYMVRTDILFAFYPDRNINPSRLGQNFQILLPVSFQRKFGYIDEPLMEYRIQPDSHSQASDPEVQYAKSCSNSDGWRDIYMDVLSRLPADPEEHRYYENAYLSIYFRSSMYRNARYHKKQELRTSYLQLKQTGYLTLEDRIIYASAAGSPLAIPLRLCRKIRILLTKHKK